MVVSEGGALPDLSKARRAIAEARDRVRLLRSARDLAQRASVRDAQQCRESAQADARESVREQARALAEQLDAALEAGRVLRLASARAARLGALPLGAGAASPEAEKALASWRDRLRGI